MDVSPNPMLLCVVHDALHAPGATDHGIEGVVLQAAVHAWMEGHIEGEGPHLGPAQPEAEPEQEAERMPSPPFPDPESDVLAAIVQDTVARLSAVPLAAAMYAAALAWAIGYEEGCRCPGCTHPGNPQLAEALRGGGLGVTLSAGRAARFTDRVVGM